MIIKINNIEVLTSDEVVDETSMKDVTREVYINDLVGQLVADQNSLKWRRHCAEVDRRHRMTPIQLIKDDCKQGLMALACKAFA